MKAPFIRLTTNAGLYFHMDIHDISVVSSDLEKPGEPHGIILSKQGALHHAKETAPQIMALVEGKYQELFT